MDGPKYKAISFTEVRSLKIFTYQKAIFQWTQFSLLSFLLEAYSDLPYVYLPIPRRNFKVKPKVLLNTLGFTLKIYKVKPKVLLNTWGFTLKQT